MADPPGRLILSTHRVPTADPFSWTAHGRVWHPNSWAFDVLLALVYRPGAHLVGVALLGVALTMLAVAAQLALAARLGAHPAAAGLMVLLATPATIAWFSVRPQLIDYAAVPVLVMLVEVALTAPGRTRAAALAGLAALHLLWVNLHATAPLGIALTGVAATVYALTGGALRTAAAPVLAAALGTLANPDGGHVLSQAVAVHDASTGLIDEWLPIDVRQPYMDLVVAVGLLAVALAARRRWWRPAAVLLVLVVAAIAARRFQPILAAGAIPVLAAALDTPGSRAWAAGRRAMLRAGAGVLTAAYLVLAALAVPHLGQVAFAYAPVRALPAGCRLFNSYDLGGAVILLRPDVPVSLDSRNDLYGRREVLAQAGVLTSTRGGVARLAGMGVTCALVRPTSGLGRQLGHDPGWRTLARTRNAAAYARR